MARVAAEPRARPSSTLALSHRPRTLLEAPPHCPETLLAGRRYMVSGHVGRLFDRRGLVVRTRPRRRLAALVDVGEGCWPLGNPGRVVGEGRGARGNEGIVVAGV